MKKISILLIFALMLSLSSTVMADLISGESGKIDSSVIFDGIPANPDNGSDTDDNETDDTSKDDNETDDTSKEDDTSKDDDTHGREHNYKPPVTSKTDSDTKTEEKAEMPEMDDVKTSDWFYSYVSYVYTNKIMMGTSDKNFEPSAPVTRAMAITVIYRMAGEPASKDSTFDDVAPSAWYAKATAWGAESKIANGTGDNKFSPNNDITREQMAVMLYNYCRSINKAGLGIDISSYSDSDKVSSWAKDAMAWAVGNKIINGKTETALAPTDKITRAETAAVLSRVAELIK